MRSSIRLACAFAVAATGLLAPRSASADAASFLSVGGGYGFKHNDTTGRGAHRGALSLAIGVGTDPTRSFVVGGMLRSTTYFALGTDLGLAARFATGGFARGQWGLALDVGPTWRSFGDGSYGRWPVSAMLAFGGPWGMQLAVGGELFKIAGDDASARGIVALFEIDLLRLTVMRQGATDKWWENPSPAGGRPAAAKARPLAGLLW